MHRKTVDPTVIEFIAGVRMGVPVNAVVQRSNLNEADLRTLEKRYENVPDEILLSMRRILKDNIGLKKIIAALLAQSSEISARRNAL